MAYRRNSFNLFFGRNAESLLANMINYRSNCAPSRWPELPFLSVEYVPGFLKKDEKDFLQRFSRDYQEDYYSQINTNALLVHQRHEKTIEHKKNSCIVAR